MLRIRRSRAASALLAGTLAGSWLLPAQARADEVRDRQRPILNLLGTEAAWKITKGEGVTVAVVDSGVDPNQADLAGKVTTGPNMLAEIDAGAAPTRLHGTAMASLIAGKGHGPGGRSGVIGMAPQARILSIRSIADDEDPSYRRYQTSRNAGRAVARGIRHAADQGVDVINLSLGKDREIPEEREAIGYALGKGVVVVSAVGNDGDKTDALDGDGFAPYSYPASYPGVIAVAATRPGQTRAPFSNRNYSVVVSAPGTGIPVAGPGGRYFIGSGTSDASAIVSGIAALIRAEHPKMAPALVAQALVQSARNGPSGGYDAELGFGEVHAARALSAAASIASAQPGPARGKAAGRRFGTEDLGPVEIIERPAWVRPLIVGIVLLGIGGTVAGGSIALAFRRRHPKPDGPAPAGPPPGSPPPGSFFGPRVGPAASWPPPDPARGPLWPPGRPR